MLHHSALLLGFLAISLFAASASRAAEPPRVEYTIDATLARTQMISVSMTIRGWHGLLLDVHLPVWRPGRYEVLDLAGAVRDVSATDAADRPLSLEKTAKSSWRVNTLGADTVTVSYRIYANSLGNRTRHADSTHAFLSGAAVFMYCHELRDQPARINIKAPPGWKTATGLSPDADAPSMLFAPDYDTLVDSPIEIGEHEVRTFDVAGTPHEIVIWGDAAAVPAKAADDFARIAQVQHDMFGGFPYRRYVFLTHIAPGIGGGTEHLNSTIIQARPTLGETAKDYRNFLALVSHELFHTWNVKQFRPAGLSPYDYSRENYTDLLWVAEGATSYYDELLCVRAGVWEPRQYLDNLAKLIDGELARPGLSVQSVAESSFDAWVKFNRPSPDSVNSTVSFYNKGALVNLLLDMEIRTRTSGAKGLDDLMRALYKRYPAAGPGYTTADILNILQELTGTDFAPFFADYVRGVKELPLADALACVGLELKRVPRKDEGVEPVTHDTLSQEPYIGLDLRDADGAAVVSAVRTDGPAYAAGIIADDQIVALDGQRLRAADLNARLRKHQVGDEVTLTFFRRERMQTLNIKLTGKPSGELKIERTKAPTPQQKATYESWIGKTW
ncbi:MAG: M61 family metallopeptidase [Planctomycetes bacterium]|nr:M61 family metallopeptidase [Planctomycetota bacterium]